MDDFGMPSDFDFKGLSLIDVSSEDDCLIGFPFFDSISPHSSGKGTENKTTRFSLDPGNVEISSGFLEEAGELEEPPGFLESEDWSSMVGGNENGEIHILPGIQEDVNGYFESLMTLELLDGETLTLEDPGADLFEDIRASIQEFSKTPNTANSSVRKHKAAPKKLNIGLQEAGKTSKQSVTRSGEPTSSLHNLPKGLISRVGSIPTIPTRSRRLSLGDKIVKMGKDARSVTGRGTTLSKTPALGSSRFIVPRSLSSKSSCSSPASSATELINYCTLLESCASILSERIEKPSLNSIKQKNDPRKVHPSSGYSISKPYKNVPKGKNQAGSSKLSSSISPANSTTVESSESVASISAANQRSNSVKASMCSVEAGVEVTGVLDGSVKKVSAETSGPLHSASMKLSGLRLSSPKTGFDGVRSSGRSTNMNMLSYSGVPGGSPKSGAKCTSPTGSSNSAKIGKLQRVRTFTAIQSPDFDVKQTSSLVRSIPSLSNQKPSNAATKVLSAPRNNPKSSTVTFPTLQNKSSPRAFRESDLEDQGVGGRIKDTKIVPLDGVLQTADNLTSMTMEKAAEKGSDSGPYCKTRTLSLHNTNQEEAPVKNSGIMEVDINSDTHKECISDYHFAHGQKELMNSLSNPTACCPVSSEITYGLRKPFSVKDSFYNIDAPLEGLSGTAPVVDKTTVLQIPESAVPENS
ncbi:Ribosomal protein S12/S23 family protein [Hibiscus syriacus]|uniref:Ribosomal protein S12/S23 family protein n=1 Tax=Hibiscus syriacus TaxID=106335 RepID=A0A6A2ZEL4_HIBSY|nr:Ribosomal protein S12/S23 family protein [Hibiscus syriacus]